MKTSLLLLGFSASILAAEANIVIDDFTQGGFSEVGDWYGVQTGGPDSIIGGERRVTLSDPGNSGLVTARLVEGSGHLDLSTPTLTGFIWINYGREGGARCRLERRRSPSAWISIIRASGALCSFCSACGIHTYISRRRDDSRLREPSSSSSRTPSSQPWTSSTCRPSNSASPNNRQAP